MNKSHGKVWIGHEKIMEKSSILMQQNVCQPGKKCCISGLIILFVFIINMSIIILSYCWYRTISHSQSEESQVWIGCEKTNVKLWNFIQQMCGNLGYKIPNRYKYRTVLCLHVINNNLWLNDLFNLYKSGVKLWIDQMDLLTEQCWCDH